MSAPRILVVQFQDDAPAAWLGDWLVEDGCALDVRHLDRGDALPASLEDHDAVVVLGGSPSADDDHPSVSATADLVRTAAAAQVPTLGVCLGHQVASVALGGTVVRNPLGPQRGVVPVDWTDAAADDPLLGALGDAGEGVHWNGDVVGTLPDGGTVLAHAPGGEIQAARLAPTVWGVQLHPEADDSLTRPWAAVEADRPGAEERDAANDQIGARREHLARAWRPLSTALTGLARDGSGLRG